MNDILIVLQARAAREFGIPWSEFDYLTPRELGAIAADCLETWIADQKAHDARAAKITAAVYRAGGAKKVKEEDLMPDYKSTKSEPIEIESAESLKAKLDFWATMANN